MPVEGSPDLLEQEHVDDTMLFCQYAPDTLNRLLSTLSVSAVPVDLFSTRTNHQWETSDDIADSSDDRSPSNSRHVHLPKLRTRQSFGLQGGKANRNEPRRRKFRRWTSEEETILRKEVERYGKGQWKHILQKHKAIFEGRTEVDLKDKWRNIEKREGIL
ncbi:hypothetical protein L7F22_017518 [Adiantum nelumboides]|nr:hypothetical protein [Adiantum nelumboides]